MMLRTCYAVSGTDLRYAPTRRSMLGGSKLGYGEQSCAVLSEDIAAKARSGMDEQSSAALAALLLRPHQRRLRP
eukprot:3073692-Rhodomonas_salina.1